MKFEFGPPSADTILRVFRNVNADNIGITMYAVSQPDSIPGLVTMNDFGETQYIGPVSRKTIKTLMFQNLTNLLVRIAGTNWSYKHIVI